MAMFGRESEATETPTTAAGTPGTRPQPRAATRSGAPTHIGAGATVQGEIRGDSDVVVEGRVEGNVRPDRDVTVSDGGSVHGSIEARRVRVAGQVEGNVRGHEVVEIAPSGRLIGDVVAPSMVIADGAFFKGSVEMSGATEPTAGRQRSAS